MPGIIPLRGRPGYPARMSPTLRTLGITLCLTLTALAGCGGATSERIVLPPAASLRSWSAIDGGGFAPDPQGRRVALAHQGLHIVAADGAEGPTLAPERPAVLAWSSDGRWLAAAFPNAQGALLRRYDGGAAAAETSVPGQVTALSVAADGTVLAVSVVLNAYSFGANVAGHLHRWSPEGTTAALPLADSTIQRRTTQSLGPHLLKGVSYAFSPRGDALVEAQVTDPPVIETRLRIGVRDVLGGASQEIATVALMSGGGVFAPDGESVWLGDGTQATRRYDVHSGQVLAVLPSPGRTLAVASDGIHVLADGQLFRGGERIASLGEDAVGRFAAGLLFLRRGTTLQVVDGLAAGR